MSALSADELKSASLDVWRCWLRDGALSFTLQAGLNQKAKAFGPFVIDPTGHNPVGDLGEQIRRLMGNCTTLPARACVGLLETWSLAYDGWPGAELLLRLGTRLGSLHMLPGILRLLRSAEGVSEDGLSRLAWVAIHAASERLTCAEAIRLGQTLSLVRIWAPHLVVEFASLLGRYDVTRLPGRLLIAIPGLLEDEDMPEIVSGISRRLLMDHDKHSLRDGFRPRREGERESRLRRELLAEVGPAVRPRGLYSGRPELLVDYFKKADFQEVSTADEGDPSAAFESVEQQRSWLRGHPNGGMIN